MIMEKRFLDIRGKKVRVEANWNAIADFCRRKNIVDLSQIDMLSRIGVDDILPLMHCCVKEGERLEGREVMMTEDELGSSVNTAKMGEFMRIYAEQSRVDLPEKNGKKK